MIGVFDSGVGGLTVLKQLLKYLPQYDYIYLGDNARTPYGEKSQEVIYEYSRQAVDFLFKKGCRLIIIACNTASAQALKRLQDEYLPKHYPNRRILGVVRPLVEEIAKRDDIKKVGIIGTRSTIDSKTYEIELHKLNPHLKVIGQSAPLLVPLIEEGWAKKPETKKILKSYLRPLKAAHVEGLIIGCTHYPFLFEEICRIMGKRCKIDSPGKVVAYSLADYLSRHGELGIKSSARPQRIFLTTDDIERFRKKGEKFLGGKMGSIEKVTL